MTGTQDLSGSGNDLYNIITGNRGDHFLEGDGGIDGVPIHSPGLKTSAAPASTTRSREIQATTFSLAVLALTASQVRRAPTRLTIAF
ncbi:MAG: hypothetical protein VKO39_07660 [Cyanobacteriota bacterium]|nr:hypothetical protein [Cyanobacteriota bacterium]